MKTFTSVCVLTVVLGMSMSVARADFDDNEVNNGALAINFFAKAAQSDIQNGNIELPVVQHRFVAASLRNIVAKSQQVANLSGAANEDAVQAQMLQLAQEIRTLVNNLIARTNDPTFDAILDEMSDFADELVDDLN